VAAFISHAQQDSEALEMLKRALDKEGVEYYVAEEDTQPGRPLSSKIVDAIKGSHVMVALLTENGAKSPTVNQEIGIAINSGLRVIPLVEKGARVGLFIDELEQFRFDHEELAEECAFLASVLSRLTHMSEARTDPSLMQVSVDFTRCRNYSILFHSSDPNSVRDLISHKCSAFVENSDLRYPRIFLPDTKRPGGLGLLDRLQRDLRSVPVAKREQVLCEYVAHLCEIDAAIVAHLEIRRAHSNVKYRDEFADIVDAYHRRLVGLYHNEVPFGRTDVARFFHDGAIVMLVNANEVDAIDYIDSYLLAALWTQLNLSYGWFEAEEEQALKKATSKEKILNKACHTKHPIKKLMWRREPPSR
jgi:hypothetical protein